MLARVLVRAVAGLLLFGSFELVGRLWPTPDANIGLGLLAMATLFVGGGIWGIVDGFRAGRRRQTLTRPVLTWVVVAPVVGIASVLWIWVREAVAGGGFSPEVLLSDLLVVAPFLTTLVAGAAVLGVIIGWAIAGAPSGSAPSGSGPAGAPAPGSVSGGPAAPPEGR